MSDGGKTLQNLNSLQKNIERYIPLFRSFGVSYLPEEIVVQIKDIDISKWGGMRHLAETKKDKNTKNYSCSCLFCL